MTAVATINGFNYTALPEDTTKSLREAADGIRSALGRAIVDVGNRLITAKGLLQHGQFSLWAQAELGMTERTAERYMRAARFLEAKPTSMSALPANIIYKLSAPSAPNHVVQDVVLAAEAGAPLSAGMIQDRLLQDRLSGARPIEHHIHPAAMEGSVSIESPEQLVAEQESEELEPDHNDEPEDPEPQLKLLVDRVVDVLGDDAWAVLGALQDHASTFERLLRQRLAPESGPTIEVAVGTKRRHRWSAA